MRRLFPAAIALTAIGLALVKTPEPARACAVVPPKGGRVDISEETAVIVWDAAARVEHFIRSASFASTSAEFGFLVPTPTKPEVTESSSDMAAELAKVTAPRTEVRTKTRIAGLNDNGPSDFSRVGTVLLPGAAAPKVTVLERDRVGAFDYAILKADDPGALREWLGKNGFDARPELENWLKFYTKNKWIITAFKLTTDASVRVNGVLKLDTSAVRLSFSTNQPFYPYREPEDARSLMAPIGTPVGGMGTFGIAMRQLRVFVLAEHRVAGTIGGDQSWPGRTVWANPVEPAKVSAVLAVGKLPEMAGRNWYVTEFEDSSFPRPGVDELYFDRSTDQSSVERPVNVVYEYREIPVGALVGVMCALGAVLLVATWLIVRRLTKPQR